MKNLKAIVGSYVGVLLFSAFIFLGAGTLRYWQAWLYVCMALLGTTLSHLLVPEGSGITSERFSQAGAGEDWDKRLLGVSAIISIVMFLTAGLDSGRFGWSGQCPHSVAIIGVSLMFAGQLLFAISKRENAFFSSTVRIQAERDHRVCDTGPYRYVRHPGYLGMLLSLLAFPLVMEAYSAFIPAFAASGVLLARTLMEDRFLVEHLPGYADYTMRTRWRLLPWVF